MTVLGQLFPVDVTGLFADGMPRNLTAPDRGTTYSSTNDAVLGVDRSGMIQARAPLPAHMATTWRFFGFDPDPMEEPLADAEP